MTGCYAQVNPAEVADVPGVDYVVGLNRLDDLLQFVALPKDRDVRIAVSDVKRQRGVPVLGTRTLPGHTRAFLKIQEGCNYSCTYCIIPTARGLSRSVTPREVLEQVRMLADAGYREIVLTGIHLGSYGQDLTPKIDLTALLEMIAQSRLIPRVRLSSLDPREVPDRLIDLMANSHVICPHLHVCAQAGDDEILKRMRRNYDGAYYRELLMKVRERLPDAALGSDIIVGFPGETDGAFDRSLEFFAALPLTYFHVFHILLGVGRLRLHCRIMWVVKLRRRVPVECANWARSRRETFVRFRGRKLSVLIEEKIDRATGLRRGFSRNYLPVLVLRVELWLIVKSRLKSRALKGDGCGGLHWRLPRPVSNIMARSHPTQANLKKESQQAQLEKELGYSFSDASLLVRALTHVSYDHEKSAGHNEVLEFLGDAVLDLAISDLLIRSFPEKSEGDLSRMRAALVNSTVLPEKAALLNLGPLLRLGKGEERSGGGTNPPSWPVPSKRCSAQFTAKWLRSRPSSCGTALYCRCQRERPRAARLQNPVARDQPDAISRPTQLSSGFRERSRP